MFFNLAFNGYLPHLLPSARDRLEGNGKLQTSASVAQVTGPGLGGLLAQVAGAVCGLLIDAITFVASAACLLSLRPGPEPRPVRADRPGMFRQIAEGFAVFRHGGFLLPMLAVATMINCGMLSIWALRIVFLVRTDGAAPGTAGALISLGSLGGILGAALASRAVSRFGSARTYLAANVATAPFMLLLPASGPAGGSCCSPPDPSWSWPAPQCQASSPSPSAGTTFRRISSAGSRRPRGSLSPEPYRSARPRQERWQRPSGSVPRCGHWPSCSP
jgi:hypothetical protein